MTRPIDDAELYSLLHSGNAGDVEHYERVCREASSVLELGSGSGRIAARLAQNGHHVTGLELHEGLLARSREVASQLPEAARRRLTLIHGDMREFSLGRRFDRIILPYNGLYCLGGVPGALRCLEAIREHLSPDGELWLDAYAVDAFHAEAPEDDQLTPEEDDEPVSTLTWGGRLVKAWERSTWNREEQRLDVRYELRDESGALVAEQQLEHHYLLTRELVMLLDEAGLEAILACGGFEGEPFDDDAELLVLGARPSSEEARDTDAGDGG